MENLETTEVKKNSHRLERPENKLKYQRDKDREIVKGMFKYYEVDGGVLNFCFKAYKEDPVEQFSLEDGKVYSIPLGVAKHLNKSGFYPQYAFLPGDREMIGAYSPDGQTMQVIKKIRRYAFHSLEFVDIEGLEESSGIVEVVKASY